MKLDFTPVYLAFGISLATYLFLRYKRITPDVKFKDITYDKLKNQMQVVIENISDHPVYVKPALRVVRFTPASEWKEKTANGNSAVPMMTAAAGSVIKGYELIGEYAEPVKIEPKQKISVDFPVMRDFGLKACDNIKIDSTVGNSPEKLEGTATGTLQLNLKELLADCGEELLEALNDYLDEGLSEPPVCKIMDGGVLESVQPLEVGEAMRKSDFPVQALCYCCGKERWLNWVVDGNHVCDECRDYLKDDLPVAADDSGTDYADEGKEYSLGYGVELVEAPQVDLKPRHKNILDVLYKENTLTAKELSKKLERKEKAVSTDLRFLLKNNLVDRVKIARQYKYFSLRDDEQIVLYDPSESEGEQPEWT
jgi:hypothetical protein